jgi:hypothetical protein
MIIAIDFDGTCVKHAYPLVGEDIGAGRILRDLVDNGHKLILWTMRSGETLAEAVKWFESEGIPLYGVNSNPTQINWTKSPKVYAELYIDDGALGAPLITPGTERPYINWNIVEIQLMNKGLL